MVHRSACLLRPKESLALCEPCPDYKLSGPPTKKTFTWPDSSTSNRASGFANKNLSPRGAPVSNLDRTLDTVGLAPWSRQVSERVLYPCAADVLERGLA